MEERKRRLLLVLLGGAHSLNHSLFLVLPFVLDTIVSEFRTSVETIGLVAGAGTLLYGLGGVFGGSLSDRFGEVKVLIFGMMLSGVSTFIFLAASDVAGFTVGLLCMAVFASLYHPIANSLITKVFLVDTGEAMGIHGTGGNIGVMFAPVIVVALSALWNWRLPFILFGILAISISFFLQKMPPPTSEKTRATGKTWDVIKVPGLWTLIAYNVAVGLYSKGVEFIFPTFLIQEREFSMWLAGLAGSCIIGIGILGQLLGGKASDLFGSKRALIATSIGIWLGLLSLQMIPHPIVSVIVYVLLFGFSFYALQPAFNSLTGVLAPTDMRGKVFGIMFFLSFGLGSVSTIITGVFADRYNLESALYFMTLFAFLAFLLSFLVPAHKKSSRGQDK